MKFLVDENIGKSIVQYLRNKRHNVVWIKELRPGMSDANIIKLALKEKRVIITYDQDFGDLIFFQKEKHYGVILIRITINLPFYHLKALKKFLAQYPSKEIIGAFWKIDDRYL